MKVLILAGGLGTRLRPVIGELPKPMADVNGKPFLEILLRKLAREGFMDIIISVGYRKDIIEEYLDRIDVGARIAYSEESGQLGTGGALRKAIELAGSSDLLLLNGDTYVSDSLSSLAKFHERNGFDATLGTVEVSEERKGGFVRIEKGRVVEFSEKVGTGTMSSGAIAFRSTTLDLLPQLDVFSIETDFMPALIGNGRVAAYRLNGELIDIGTPEGYRRIREVVKG
ncbi:MAG: NTP transferase domain-containing protein [Nitrososphaerota archaeon]|nr:NTP transferase domain-containing protein [Nitrososphaerota archaeon]MDG7052114.1 NTP transferase domain-containing protein [Nitrososphaerota archaeon]